MQDSTENLTGVARKQDAGRGSLPGIRRLTTNTYLKWLGQFNNGKANVCPASCAMGSCTPKGTIPKRQS